MRQQDPPYADCDAPEFPLPSIAPEDQIIAYHFLVRATFSMLMTTTALTAHATPYLMAFSTLARVRFAHVSVTMDDAGLSILPTPIQETDFATVKQMFQEMVQPIN